MGKFLVDRYYVQRGGGAGKGRIFEPGTRRKSRKAKRKKELENVVTKN